MFTKIAKERRSNTFKLILKTHETSLKNEDPMHMPVNVENPYDCRLCEEIDYFEESLFAAQYPGVANSNALFVTTRLQAHAAHWAILRRSSSRSLKKTCTVVRTSWTLDIARTQFFFICGCAADIRSVRSNDRV
jgi:hypothetical protein